MQPQAAEGAPGRLPVVVAPRGGRIWQRALHDKWPITAAFVLLVLILWEMSSRLPTAPDYLVGPAEIFATMAADAPRLLGLSFATLFRVLAGFLIGALFGALVGMVNGTIRGPRDVTDPVITVTYPIPKVALFPAIAVILGYTDVSRVLIIALAAFYPAYFSGYAGSQGVDRNLLNLARNAGLSRARTFTTVIVRASLPSVFTGLRISLAVSFVLVYVAEALGGSGQGLGFRVVFVAQTDQYVLLFAAIGCFAILGVLGDRILLWIGRTLTRGQELEVLGDAR